MLGLGWEGGNSDTSWVLPALPPSSTPPLMLESSCQGLRTTSMAKPWGSFFRTSSGKRPMVSPCLGQGNSVSSESQMRALPWATQGKFSPPSPASQRASNPSFPKAGRRGSGSEWAEHSLYLQKHYVPRTSTLTSFRAPGNPNLLKHKMELTPSVRV